jgi:hypothetical protein
MPSAAISFIFDRETDDSQSLASISSLATTNAEMSGQSPPPVDLSHGVEFKCTICFKMQGRIYNNFLWE